MTLCDGTTGQPLAVMDGAVLTALAPAHASDTATDLLARPEAATAAILGAGVQACTQLDARKGDGGRFLKLRWLTRITKGGNMRAIDGPRDSPDATTEAS